MITKKVTIKNPSGLHMRPAGIFVKTVSVFDSEVQFNFKDETYNAKSMINVLSAMVKNGDEIELCIDGEDEQQCMEAIVEAIESGLGE